MSCVYGVLPSPPSVAEKDEWISPGDDSFIIFYYCDFIVFLLNFDRTLLYQHELFNVEKHCQLRLFERAILLFDSCLRTLSSEAVKVLESAKGHYKFGGRPRTTLRRHIALHRLHLLFILVPSIAPAAPTFFLLVFSFVWFLHLEIFCLKFFANLQYFAF